MKTYDFTIKVADLLHQPGATDTISFVNKFSTRFPQLTNQGIAATIELTGLNDTDLTGEIIKLQAQMILECDRCGDSFQTTVHVPDETIKASTAGLGDEVLLIDKKNERIDLEERLTDSVRMQLPVQILCKTCERKPTEEYEEITDTTTIKRVYPQ